jgi:hypothetical protein
MEGLAKETHEMNKHQRYRQKCVSEGRCPHCGVQCAPFLECEDRRLRKRLLRVLGMAVKAGAVEKLSKGGKTTWRFRADAPWPKGKVSGRPGDRRLLPKIGDKPTNAGPIIRWIAQDIATRSHDRTVSEEQIAKALGELRLRHSRRTA